MTDSTQQDDACRCPHCGGTSFSWSATIRELGTVRHDQGEVTLYDREELGEVTDINFHSLYCGKFLNFPMTSGSAVEPEDCEECDSPVDRGNVVIPDDT